MENRNYANFKESPLARSQARRLLSDYAYWYQLIMRGLIFSIPMAIIFILALISRQEKTNVGWG